MYSFVFSRLSRAKKKQKRVWQQNYETAKNASGEVVGTLPLQLKISAISDARMAGMKHPHVGVMDCCRRPFTATTAALLFLYNEPLVCSFFSPAAIATSSCPSSRFWAAAGGGQDQHALRSAGPRASRCRQSRASGGVTMERPSGQFNRLAKPAFDRDNPNAVLGEVKVPGLEQV